jgi:hypothetical protein
MSPEDLRLWHEHQATIRRASAAKYAAIADGPNSNYNMAKERQQLKWAAFHEDAAKCLRGLMRHAEDQFYAGIEVGYTGAKSE